MSDDPSKVWIVVSVVVVVIAAAVIGIAIGLAGGSPNSATPKPLGVSTSTTGTGRGQTNPAARPTTTPSIATSSTAPSPVAATPATSTPAPTIAPRGTTSTPAPDSDTIYLKTVRSVAPALEALPDAQLVAVGHTACTQLLDGAPLTTVVTNIRPTLLPASPSDLGIAGLVGAAIGEYCPSATATASANA